MPVTIKPVEHASRKWTRSDAALTPEDLLRNSCPTEYRRCKSIVQSSFRKVSSPSPLYPSSNGFVRAAIAAYCSHHHLSLRPEDIWFAILTQLGFFVKAHAEDLRSFFVSHEGRKELEVKAGGNIRTVDFGALAQCMSKLIADNVVDPELRTWIMPAFSTTTDTDRVVASVLMMGALQKYFSYRMTLCCGIPSVTLIGTRADWEDMLHRLEKLPQLGPEPTQFYGLLKPVLTYFVLSFDSPSAPSVVDFWRKIAHQSGGSGPPYLSGWLTAFCFWDEDGKSLYAPQGTGPSGPVKIHGFDATKPGCDLDGTLYHRVKIRDIPGGYASVFVKVDDNGTLYDTYMVAGSVGICVTSSGEALDEDNRHGPRNSFTVGPNGERVPSVHIPAIPTGDPGPDSLQPVSGWWMYEVEGQQSTEGEGGQQEIKHGEKGDLEEVVNGGKRKVPPTSEPAEVRKAVAATA